jgi:hypothetical protein
MDALTDSHGHDAWLKAVEEWADPRFRDVQIASFRARLEDDGEPGRQTLPVVAPEILNLVKWHASSRGAHFSESAPIARAFHRKFLHECRTGHKPKFLARP